MTGTTASIVLPGGGTKALDEQFEVALHKLALEAMLELSDEKTHTTAGLKAIGAKLSLMSNEQNWEQCRVFWDNLGSHLRLDVDAEVVRSYVATIERVVGGSRAPSDLYQAVEIIGALADGFLSQTMSSAFPDTVGPDLPSKSVH